MGRGQMTNRKNTLETFNADEHACRARVVLYYCYFARQKGKKEKTGARACWRIMAIGQRSRAAPGTCTVKTHVHIEFR